jgi:hypothetical protein
LWIALTSTPIRSPVASARVGDAFVEVILPAAADLWSPSPFGRSCRTMRSAGRPGGFSPVVEGSACWGALFRRKLR